MANEADETFSIDPIVLNFGGEGEVTGAININNLIASRYSEEVIRTRGPLIVTDMRSVPLPDGYADEIIGNHLPWLATPEYAGSVCAEAFRLLRPGGRIRLYASTGGGAVCLSWIREAGFINVGLEARYAKGVKP